MAKSKSSKVVLRTDMMFTGYSHNGYTVPLDSSPSVGGHEGGVRPVDLMLMSLAGCTGMDVLSILRKKRQEVTALEVQVEGERADDHPRVWTKIRVKFVVTGRNVDPKAVQRSIELSRDQYCPAAATLRHTAQIEYDFVIHEAEVEQP